MKELSTKLIDKLQKRVEEGTFRSLSHLEGLVDFSSNDYLSLANVPSTEVELIFSGTGSRLISGTSQASLQCESDIANFFEVETALVFNSGYDANVGLFSSLPQRGDTVLYDSDIHASVKDGIRLSHAHSFSFRHNDIGDLERLLKKAKGDVYVAVESLYSMKGDIAPLVEISELTQKHGAYLTVDEAHAAGVLGESGRGLVHELGLTDQVHAVVVTFGKAFGAHGAAVLSNRELSEFLINFARSFIYTTALPPESYRRISAILKREDLSERRSQLRMNIQLIRSLIPVFWEVSHPDSPIQIYRMIDRNELRTKADLLCTEGFSVKPIFAPTVSEKEECLRISLHAGNTETDIKKLAEILNFES